MAGSAHPSRRTLHSTRWRVAVAVTAAALLAIPSAAQASGYQDLRSPDTRDAAREAALAYTDLRSPDARDSGQGYVTASQPLLVAAAPSTSDGLDWLSAAIGAGVGLLLMSLVVVGVARRGRGPLVRRQRHGF